MDDDVPVVICVVPVFMVSPDGDDDWIFWFVSVFNDVGNVINDDVSVFVFVSVSWLLCDISIDWVFVPVFIIVGSVFENNINLHFMNQ